MQRSVCCQHEDKRGGLVARVTSGGDCCGPREERAGELEPHGLRRGLRAAQRCLAKLQRARGAVVAAADAPNQSPVLIMVIRS